MESIYGVLENSFNDAELSRLSSDEAEGEYISDNESW